jgi:hypothetical protein
MSKSLLALAFLGCITAVFIFGMKSCEGVATGTIGVGIREFSALVTGFLGLAPQQTSKTVLVVQGTKEVTQYVFLEDTQYGEKNFENKWLWSKKEYHLWAKHRVKIGVDLNHEQFRFEYQGNEKDGHTIFVNYPKPKVLSTELTDLGMKSVDGSWNFVHDKERVDALKALKDDATNAAERDENLTKAAKRFEEHFTALILSINPNAKIIFNSPFKASSPTMP